MREYKMFEHQGMFYLMALDDGKCIYCTSEMYRDGAARILQFFEDLKAGKCTLEDVVSPGVAEDPQAVYQWILDELKAQRETGKMTDVREVDEFDVHNLLEPDPKWETLLTD